jgi:hypothetical protein
MLKDRISRLDIFWKCLPREMSEDPFKTVTALICTLLGGLKRDYGSYSLPMLSFSLIQNVSPSAIHG